MKRLIILLFIGMQFCVTECFGKDTTIEKAWFYYLKGDYEDAVNVCRVISKSNILGEEGRYIMGLALLQLDQPQEARKNFEFLIENYSYGKKKQEAMLGIAASYYKEEAFDKAEKYYTQFLRDFSGTDYVAIAYLALGECQQKLGKWQEAESSFCKVAQDFPLSIESKKAHTYLNEKKNFFSVQVGAFSKKENADGLSERLRHKGYDSYVDKIYNEDRLMYRVRVGTFATQKEAEEEAKRLKVEGLSVRICS